LVITARTAAVADNVNRGGNQQFRAVVASCRCSRCAPSAPTAERDAKRELTRFLNEVDQRRNPKTNATVEQLLTRYLDKHFDGEPSTRNNYRRYARLDVRRPVGELLTTFVTMST